MATAFPNNMLTPGQPLSGKSRENNSSLVIRNVTINGHRTSIRLEPEFWDGMTEMCRREYCTPHDICSAAAERKSSCGSLTSQIRIMILDYFRKAGTEDGHYRSGHGQGLFVAKHARQLDSRPLYRKTEPTGQPNSRLPALPDPARKTS